MLGRVLALYGLVKPGLGFGFFHTAWRTLKGYEVMNMIRKGQLRGAERGDLVSQNRLIAQAFGLTQTTVPIPVLFDFDQSLQQSP